MFWLDSSRCGLLHCGASVRPDNLSFPILVSIKAERKAVSTATLLILTLSNLNKVTYLQRIAHFDRPRTNVGLYDRSTYSKDNEKLRVIIPYSF